MNRVAGSPARRPGGSILPHSTSSRSDAAPVSGVPVLDEAAFTVLLAQGPDAVSPEPAPGP